jgi:hypothetical protein
MGAPNKANRAWVAPATRGDEKSHPTEQRNPQFPLSYNATMQQPPIWFMAIILIILLSIIASYFAMVAWAIGDAKSRGQSGCLPPLLFWLFGPLAIVIWLIVRPKEKIIDKDVDTFCNADDAIYAASQLDSEGEWDAAIFLYQHIEKEWPEFADYCQRCIAEIDAKKGSSTP